MNKVALIGRVVRQPDVRYTQGQNGQTCVARYTLAVDRRRRVEGEQNADFISCVAFGRSGEFADKYFRKGIKIAVSGRIQTGSYVNKDGVKVYTTDVVVEDQEFCESRSSAAADTGAAQEAAGPAPAPATDPAPAPRQEPTPAPQYGARAADLDRRMSRTTYGGNNAQRELFGRQDDALDGFMNIPDSIDEELPFV